MVRRLIMLVAVLTALLVGAVSASAAGEGAVTSTETERNATDAVVGVLPCAGEGMYTVTFTYNEVDHATFSPDGSVHFTFTQTGTFTAVPEDPSQPAFSGRFTLWFGLNADNDSAAATFTESMRGTGTDGARVNFQTVEHFNASTSGITNEFIAVRCA